MVSGFVRAQWFPAEHRSLHYRIIEFRDDRLPSNNKYTLEIAKGQHFELASFEKAVLKRIPFSGRSVLGEVPRFGTAYTWRVVGAPTVCSELHHFSTGMINYVDTNYFRLKVRRPATKYSDAYVFLDGTGTLYNMKGEPVWYMPMLKDGDIVGTVLRDMKMTNRNTISFIFRDNPLEITWDGTILFSGPISGLVSGDTLEHFHHEFTRLNSGKYMVLGTEYRMYRHLLVPKSMGFGTVIEYDAAGKLVWSFRSSEVYGETHYEYDDNVKHDYDVHQNAFCFDERSNSVYVGFKHVSQILKIRYPDCDLLATYGKKFNGKPDDISPFAQQHSIQVTKAGNILLFNNNNPDRTPAHFHPKIMVLKEQGDQLQTLWEYEYLGNSSKTDVPGLVLTNGGNALEMSDASSYFVSMCAPFANLFIVNKNKQLLWEATPQKLNKDTQVCSENPQYRSSIVPSRQALEAMVSYRFVPK
jgi:hypothetical protein